MRLLLALKGCASDIQCIAFSPDGRRIAAGANNGIQLWLLDTGELISSLVRRHGVRFIAFSPDGEHIVSVSLGKYVEVLSSQTGKQEYALSDSFDVSLTTVFSPDGRQVAIGGRHGSLQLWTLGNGKALHVVEPDGMLYLSCVQRCLCSPSIDLKI